MCKLIVILSIFFHGTISIKIDPIPASIANLGFGPIWDDCTQCLFYVDYTAIGKQFSIFRYVFNERRVYTAYIEGGPSGPPSYIYPLNKCSKRNNLFGVGISHYNAIIEWDGKSSVAKFVKTEFAVEEFDPTSRWCAAKPSKHGRFYGGTASTRFCNSPSNASFYKYSHEKGVQQLFGGLVSTTGIAYDENTLYHVDGCTSIITAYDFDSNGDICNGRIVFDFKKLGYGLPDFSAVSLEIDSNRNLYTTNYAGNTIWKIDLRTSTATVLAEMPYKGLGGIALGGPKQNILFVVTVSNLVNLLLAKVTENTSVPTSLYEITDVGAEGLQVKKCGYSASTGTVMSGNTVAPTVAPSASPTVNPSVAPTVAPTVTVDMQRYIEVGNECDFPIWIQTLTNDNGPPLLNTAMTRINPGGRMRYDIGDDGWAGRLWARYGCDENGQNCLFGQSSPPCSSSGCDPPADTKAEFSFPPRNSATLSFYDISLVDGFSLACEIIPVQNGVALSSGSCSRTDCQLSVNQCPTNEIDGLGNLMVTKGSQAVACLSPCKRWNYPAPFGLGLSEQQGDGLQFCCPSPITVDQCRSGIVTQTQYVNLVQSTCPSAYSYSYDDVKGLHSCASQTSYIVNFSF